MRKYETFELTYSGPSLKDGWACADLSAEFVDGGGKTTVKGFCAGDGVYKLRYLPEYEGPVRWKVSGIVCDEGETVCGPASENAHGVVRADGTSLRCSDGTPFFSFGTTVYALAHQNAEITEQTFAELAAGTFNKVRMCVFPKHYAYNVNDPDHFPFELNEGMTYAFERGEISNTEEFNLRKAKLWDVSRPCFAFWDALEEKIGRLGRMGIQADLILFHPYDRWGFSCFGPEQDRLYLDYLLRRFSALPNVWWSLANEYDLCAHKRMEDWYAIEAFVAGNDPYRHLLSAHNCFTPYDFGRENITHCSLQKRTMSLVPSYMRAFGKPVLYDECVYEGNLRQTWGTLSGREMVNRFWKVTVHGGYCTHGEVLLDPEITDPDQAVLWWAKGGRLKGESPARIAYLRKLIEEIGSPLLPYATGSAALSALLDADPGAEKTLPESTARMMRLRASMEPVERALFEAEETLYAGHTADDRHIIFYCGTDCYGRFPVQLPAGKRYRIEVIDAWNMNRECFAESAEGNTEVRLPGREYMAVLCTCL